MLDLFKSGAGWGTLLTFGEPEKTSLKTSFQEFISLRQPTGLPHPGLRDGELSTPPVQNKNQSKDWSLFWCSIVDVFQTAAIDAQEDYRLKHLVEQFSLSGSLLDAY